MTKVCKHLFGIISIRRNKREDQTTLGSTFSIENVSYWVFSTGFNGSKWIWKSFLLILVDFCTKSEKNEKSVWLWAIKKMVGESFQDMTSVWKHFFRIIAIRRNKRDDHTTLGSIFNVGNVSYWWFFVVQSDLEWFWGENWVKIHKKVKRRNEESELKRHEQIF